MRLWKLVLIVGIVASGFGAGYLANLRKVATNAPPSAPVPLADVKNEPRPPGYDPSLILPPPDTKGVTLEPAMLMIDDHFHRAAGLKKDDAAPVLETPAIQDLQTGQPGRLPILGPPPAPPSVGDRPSVIQTGASAPFIAPRLSSPMNLPNPVHEPAASNPPAPEPPPGDEFSTRGESQIVRLPAPDADPIEIVFSPELCPVPPQLVQERTYTNSRQVFLNFEVGQRGVSGIKATELWARRSSDADFECVDRMEGDKPPFPAHLGSEGTYEFRLVFESGTGVRSPAPKRHDAPDLVVQLDTTKPQVELLPPVSHAPGIVGLRWTAKDENLEDNPIRLQFSVDGESWRSVTVEDAWMPNCSGYDWAIPENLPSQLYLRVLARDKAGNVGESRSPNKYSVDLTVPDGRLSGLLEPLPMPRVLLEVIGYGCAFPLSGGSLLNPIYPPPPSDAPVPVMPPSLDRPEDRPAAPPASDPPVPVMPYVGDRDPIDQIEVRPMAPPSSDPPVWVIPPSINRLEGHESLLIPQETGRAGTPLVLKSSNGVVVGTIVRIPSLPSRWEAEGKQIVDWLRNLATEKICGSPKPIRDGGFMIYAGISPPDQDVMPFWFQPSCSDQPKPETYLSERHERYLDMLQPLVTSKYSGNQLFQFGMGFFN